MACILCGTSRTLELRNTDCIKLSVSKTYSKGPFAYANVFNFTEQQCWICIHCLNHIRKRKMKNVKKKMLPMDHFLLSLLNLELASLMDLRSKKRMQQVLKEENNLYRNTNILPLNLLIRDANPINRWWMLNLKTCFFVGGKTSRCIRIHIS